MLDLSHLNPQQKEAVETTEGPLLILAGAGSGKTSVLTHRIAYILDAGLAAPHSILAMTFTNKAAGEMKERVAHLLQKNSSGSHNTMSYLQWMGTFHSMGVKLLKRHGGLVGIDTNFVIYDSSDQLGVIKEAMGQCRISIKEVKPRAIQNYISSAKNELISPESYAQMAYGYFQEQVASVYPVYEKLLRRNNAVDFDDLILLQNKLFDRHQDILAKYQEQFRYILVDEYQDTNHAQYRVVKALAAKYKNICAVGDDDQSIYAFRGATIKNILSFEKDYPDAKVIKLEQNYRSTKKILEASYAVISHNKARKDKKLWTENDTGDEIVQYEAQDEIDEAEWIVKQIEAQEGQVDRSDIAVLYRTNAQSRSLEEAFINYGIPYRIVGGVRFYDRKEIKDMLAYLRVLYNPKDTQSLMRIINTPRRGIGKKTIEDLQHAANSIGKTPGALLFTPGAQLPSPKLTTLASLLQVLANKQQEMDLVAFLEYLLEKSGYFAMLDDNTSENEARIENLKELITVASQYLEYDPAEGLAAFLEDVALLEGVASIDAERTDVVTLMTIHSAKGLEFSYVFVVGMEENLFPHSNSMFDDKELEEERRLAYVAITRAKEKLHLTHAKSRKYFGSVHTNPVSRFLEDIPPELIAFEAASPYSSTFSDVEESFISHTLSFSPGDRVKHEYFGIGKIVYLDDEIVEVDFGTIHGKKELMVEYARLTKVG